MITTPISTLNIHKLTQAQYERIVAAGNIDANALYLTTDSAANDELITIADIDEICGASITMITEDGEVEF